MRDGVESALAGFALALVVGLIAWSVREIAREYAPTPLDTSSCEVAATEPVKVLICTKRLDSNE